MISHAPLLPPSPPNPIREEGTPHGSDPPAVEFDNDDSTANLVSSTLIDMHSNNSNDDISIIARGKSINKFSRLSDKNN